MIVRLSSSLRRLAGGQAVVSESAATVGDLLDHLGERFPGFAARVCEPDGAIRRHINIFVNGHDVRNLKGRATPLVESDEVIIAAAMAGG